MTNWNPELESRIRDFANTFDNCLTETFNAASEKEALNVLARVDVKLVRLHDEIIAEMGFAPTPGNAVTHMTDMIALAKQNGSDAGDKLPKVWDKHVEMAKYLNQYPGEDGPEHGLKVAKRVGFKY